MTKSRYPSMVYVGYRFQQTGHQMGIMVVNPAYYNRKRQKRDEKCRANFSYLVILSSRFYRKSSHFSRGG